MILTFREPVNEVEVEVEVSEPAAPSSLDVAAAEAVEKLWDGCAGDTDWAMNGFQLEVEIEGARRVFNVSVDWAPQFYVAAG